MRNHTRSLILTTLLLAACPQPPDGSTVGKPPTGAPAGDAVGATGPGAAAGGAAGGAAGVAGTPPEGGPIGEAPPPASGGKPAAFSNLPSDTKTVTLTIKLEGAADAQVDLTRVLDQDGRKVPEVVHSADVAGGTLTLQVPADYEYPLYLLAFVDENSDGPSAGELVGFDKKPIEIGTEDLSATIKLSKDPKILESVPWYDPNAPKVDHPDLPTVPSDSPPAGAGTPSGPAVPPEGGAPATPPADGAAPPADGAAPPADGAAPPAGQPTPPAEGTPPTPSGG